MRIFDWLDDRTGYRKLVRTALFEHVPGGARWRYVWGSTLSFAIVVQFITGIFLWMHYSPSAQSAWESVYYINDVMPGGWILRGIHHFMAQLMVPLLILHFMQVMLDGAYKAPREFNYWFGLGLLVLTLAISLTGYLLPWDQRGYWSTKVATNLAGNVPLIGDNLQRVVVGDANYGHHTLTRFFALHAGVLPAALVGLIVVHVALFRKHGLTPKLPKKKPDTMFWPDQVLKDAVACIIVMGVALGLVWYFKGAELGAPANPSESYDAARPDWYFMFLFQFLKYFKGDHLIWGSLIIPGIVFGIFMLMPFLGRWKRGHVFNLVMLFAGLAGFAALTAIAYTKDARDPRYRAAVAQAHEDARRTKLLASQHDGIPTEGALAFLRNDPPTQGPRLFAKECASCHTYKGHNGLGLPMADKDRSAPDLAGFGSREWLRGFMDPKRIETLHYFGGTRFVNPPPDDATKSKLLDLRGLLAPPAPADTVRFEADLVELVTKEDATPERKAALVKAIGGRAANPDERSKVEAMATRLGAEAKAPKKSKMVNLILEKVPKYDAEEKAQLEKIIMAISAEAKLPSQKDADARDMAQIEEGRKLLKEVALDCTNCHSFGDEEGDSGPTLVGYGSVQWLKEFITNPAHEKFYGKRNDRMPHFGEGSRLNPAQLELLVRWMRGE